MHGGGGESKHWKPKNTVQSRYCRLSHATPTICMLHLLINWGQLICQPPVVKPNPPVTGAKDPRDPLDQTQPGPAHNHSKATGAVTSPTYLGIDLPRQWVYIRRRHLDRRVGYAPRYLGGVSRSNSPSSNSHSVKRSRLRQLQITGSPQTSRAR